MDPLYVRSCRLYSSLTDINVLSLSCGHTSCHDCLVNWFQTSLTRHLAAQAHTLRYTHNLSFMIFSLRSFFADFAYIPSKAQSGLGPNTRVPSAVWSSILSQSRALRLKRLSKSWQSKHASTFPRKRVERARGERAEESGTGSLLLGNALASRLVVLDYDVTSQITTFICITIPPLHTPRFAPSSLILMQIP